MFYGSFSKIFLICICILVLVGCQTVETKIQETSTKQSTSLSELAQKLSLRLSWDPQQRKAILDREEYRIEIEPNIHDALVFGEPVILEFPAYLRNKEIYVPTSFCEYLQSQMLEKTYPLDPPIVTNDNTGNHFSVENPLDIPEITFPAFSQMTTTEKNTLDMQGFRIALDAGHGGKDPGAIGYDNISYEKTYTLDIVSRVYQLLSKHNASIFLTRNRDVYVSKEDRAKFSNQADIMISVHLNSAATSQAGGYEFWISPSKENYTKNLRLAKHISRGFSSIKIRNRGIRRNSFYVLTHSQIPSVLVEVCFISNKDDFTWISKSDSRQDVAQAIYEGILTYYSSIAKTAKK